MNLNQHSHHWEAPSCNYPINLDIAIPADSTKGFLADFLLRIQTRKNEISPWNMGFNMVFVYRYNVMWGKWLCNFNKCSISHRIHGAAILMVCHGSHPYTPVMLALIYQHQPDPSWVRMVDISTGWKSIHSNFVLRSWPHFVLRHRLPQTLRYLDTSPHRYPAW